MVQICRQSFVYEYRWEEVTTAHWLKYPNPFASHVITADVLDRQVVGGSLSSTRLFLKVGNIPRWGQGILKSGQAFILETSTVDPRRKVMEVKTKNLSHRGIMSVVERQTIRPHPENKDWTVVDCHATIESQIGWGLTGRIEHFGLKRFRDNAIKSSHGMQWILNRFMGARQ